MNIVKFYTCNPRLSQGSSRNSRFPTLFNYSIHYPVGLFLFDISFSTIPVYRSVFFYQLLHMNP